MLEIRIDETEFWDPVKEEFIHIKPVTLQLEHSLISISKWESKWHKAFLGKQQKTNEELYDYFRCMCLNPNVDPLIFTALSPSDTKTINDYILDSMSATNLPEHNDNRRSKDVVTSELIYYWMVALQIPFECQKWHLNRLLKLIQVCNAKNTPSKKMSKGDLKNRSAINAQRRKAMGSRG